MIKRKIMNNQNDCNIFYSKVKKFIDKYLLQRIEIFFYIFLIFICGVILYSNFNKNVDLDALYSFQDFLIIIIMIILGALKDSLLLVCAIMYFIVIIAFIYLFFFHFLYPQVLRLIVITKNKFLRPIFLKLFFGKIIAKKFLTKNREEIMKLKNLKNWEDNKIIDWLDDVLISAYESAINPLSYNINYGSRKKPDKNYLQDPNLTDFKFNFIRDVISGIDFQSEEYEIIKKYIKFCENIVFNNKIIPSIKIINKH